MLVTQPASRPFGRLELSRLADLVTLTRPAHTMKTVLLVPVALIDAPFTRHGVTAVGWAIVAFVLAAAAVYVGNDIADRERDLHHPVKRDRPVAAGRISVRAGIAYCAALLSLLGVLIGLGLGGPCWPVLGYLVLNVAYSRGLKHVPLLDVGIVALGFVLRIMQGYVALGLPVPTWLVVTVLSVSLLLLVGKRRHELLTAGITHRPALRGYSVELTNQLLPLTGALSLVAGLIYLGTDAPFGSYHQVAVLLSVPFALIVLFRYLQLLVVNGDGGDPVRVLLRDPAMVVSGVLWVGALLAVLAVARSHGVLS